MSDCCSSTSARSGKKDTHACPVDGQEYSAVSEQTLLQHIREPWNWQAQPMYFCSNPDCPVIYFGKDGSLLTQDDVRTDVGIKDASDQATLCYCFGICRGEATKNPHLKDFVVEKTREKLCACEIRNPSGKCCLKYFPSSRKTI